MKSIMPIKSGTSKICKRFAIGISIVCFLLPLISCSTADNTGAGGTGVISDKYVSAHPSFMSLQELQAILASQEEKADVPKGRIVSAVMPHHLVAGRLLANALDLLAEQEPELVILAGPNHTNKGGRIITGFFGWQTPEGIVSTEDEVISDLLAKGLAVRDEEVLSREHSVGALAPLLKHYLPKARIVPLVLHHDVSLQEIDELLEGLKPHLNEKAVLISSVDFSHYLTRSEAQAKDRETLSYMRNFDYPALFSLGNDYLDSPPSLAAAFRLAERSGLKDFQMLDNTNSGIILQNDFIETTSYFTLVFAQPSI